MNDDEPKISLKEYFEKIIALDRENFKTVLNLKEDALKLQAASSQVALSLQAKEYERRLEALNNEHERIAKAQSTYVSYSVLTTVISIGIAIAAIYFRVGF